jgi:glycine cleavage system transcriptional repressor
MKRYLLTAAGRDRPGLVAAVSKILFEEGCNLEDSAMTRLQGEFAILLILSGPGSNGTNLKKS